MRIYINNKLSISPFKFGDETALQAYLNKDIITQNLLSIPRPYTQEIAQAWVKENIEFAKKYGHHLNLVIRNEKGQLIGGIGKKQTEGENFRHTAEIGFWLAPEYWGMGITSQCVAKYTAHLLQNEGFTRIIAYVFEQNGASARVLEKSGYKLEGILNKFALKNGEYYNALLYAYLK